MHALERSEAAISAIRHGGVKWKQSGQPTLGHIGQTDYLILWRCFMAGADMLRVQKVKVDDIYVPTARRKTLHPETVRHLAEDILENGMKMPIQVRHDGKRHVLVEGLHRLEAAKWLGETEIDAYLVQARRH
nr:MULTISPECIES: ParB N-terminal domain-containing protein [unclassified Mesorhizobium]